ncbi:GDSL family lipase [Sphingomonas montana]|uniref:GDSL family lipase n=1 Tax=Sphingomonas montana TaxID=1843236 RepID=UPI00096D84F1|nr:GDSL family lipase [Sphingomonas montana]
MKRRLLLVLAVLAAAAGPVWAAPCVGTLCNADELSPVFAKLAKARTDRGARPVHILQIGDSHTAGDAITGAWRDLLQARYGGGGRGVLAAGRPYAGYLTRGVTAAMSPGWRVNASFGAGSAPLRPAIGVAGFSLTSTTPGASMSLTSDGAQSFDRFVLCAIARPSAGALTVRIGLAESRFDLDSNTERPQCRTFALDRPNAAVTVTASERPVTITSWATFRDDGGVVLSNVGVVGSQLVHFGRTDDAVLAEEFRSYRPDMIVLAYGTNEGFSPSVSPFGYESTLRSAVGRLRRLAGNVPILLLGAPDAASRQPALLNNAPGSAIACSVPAVRVAMPAPVVVPAAIQPKVQDMDATIAALAGEGGGVVPVAVPVAAPVAMVRPAVSGLFVPPGMKVVRDIQRKVAGELGLAFWDWGARMGGACSAPKWVRGTPARMRGDYVHFNSAGGRDIAARLQADLDAAGMGR